MSITERVDRVQQRNPVLGFPIAVIYKFGDDFGNYLAALLTYYALVSVLPLLLLGTTILSIVLVGHPHLKQELLDSALGTFPVIGPQLRAPSTLGGGTAAVVIGVLGSLYGALGVAQALQYAGNTVWGIPRNRRPNPFLARGRSIVLVLTAGLGMLVAVGATIFLHGHWGTDSTTSRVGGFLVGVLVFTLVLMVAFRLAVKKRVGPLVLLPGVLLSALGLQVLQSLSYTYVDSVIKHASDVNAVFATVLGMLAYLYLAAMIVVLSMEVNVVRHHRLWPRALLTPFTDDVDLTDADRLAYARQARAQRSKGYQEISVVFHPRPDEASDEASDEGGDEGSTPQ